MYNASCLLSGAPLLWGSLPIDSIINPMNGARYKKTVPMTYFEVCIGMYLQKSYYYDLSRIQSCRLKFLSVTKHLGINANAAHRTKSNFSY